MIERSQNGWRASRDPAAIGAVWWEVPTVPDRRFRTVDVAAPLFKYVVRRFDAEVDRVTGGVMDEWSYHYRPIRGQTVTLSNHSSATAIDVDATQFPLGTRNMSPEQRAACRRIVKACRGQIRWGGDFSRPDEMHFELAPGTSARTVEEAEARMGLHADGRVLKVTDLGRDHKVRVPLLKAALAAVDLHPRRPVYSSKWTPRLNRAWQMWKLRRPSESVQVRLDTLGARAGLF